MVRRYCVVVNEGRPSEVHAQFAWRWQAWLFEWLCNRTVGSP